MKLLGKGMHGIVFQKSDTIAKKYHTDKEQWQMEKDNLTFLAKQKDLDIGCTIPRVYGRCSDHTVIDGIDYPFWNELELIPGTTAHDLFVEVRDTDPSKLGKSLGTVLFNMGAQLNDDSLKDSWLSAGNSSDQLFRHIFDFKAAKILQAEKDPKRLQMVQQAMDYLSEREHEISEQRQLHHLDLNMRNILVDKNDQVEGLVDWASFGCAHPSITMYQLTRTRLWSDIEKQYEQLGGVLRKDLLYAATVIHVAWSTIHNIELGNNIDHEDAPYNLIKFHKLFQEYSLDLKND